jgi:urease accessory protein
MTDDASLEAFRLADSFLPVGTNSVSYGLEQFVQDGRISDPEELHELLETHLRRLLGPAELVAVRHAHAAAIADDIEGVREADRRLHAVTLAAEFRESARRSGNRLLTLQRDLRDDPLLERYGSAVDDGTVPGNYAVVLGASTGLAGIDEREACLLCCHGYLTGMLGAAQRLLSLGHTDVQRLLSGLRPTVSDAVEESATRDLDEMSSFAPLVDVLSAEHERAERRLFLS